MAELARMVLLGALARLLHGQPLTRAEALRARTEVRLAGFRGAVRSLLLRRWLGTATALASALEGRFALAVSPADFGPGGEILATGRWEPHLVAVWPRLVKPGACVVDVGANVGFHALHSALLAGPNGRVVAVEPDPANVSLLRLSLSLLRGAAPVEVVEAALGDQDGELVLTDLGNPGNSGARFTGAGRDRLAALVHGARPSFSAVRALRWDGHWPDLRIDLVKLDVEGFEPSVLRGMEGALRRFRPIVVTEFAPANLREVGETQPREFLRWFEDRRYRGFALDESGLAPDRVTGCDWLPDGHHADLVFLPEELPDEALLGL